MNLHTEIFRHCLGFIRNPKVAYPMSDPSHCPLPAFGLAGQGGTARIMERTHQHHDLEINFFTEGRLTLLHGGRPVVLEPRRMVLFWAATPHQVLRIEGEPRFFWFTLPMAWAGRWALPGAGWSRLLEGGLFVDDGGGMGDRATCERWLADLGCGPLAHRSAALLEMEALARRLMAIPAVSHNPARVNTGGIPHPVERMAAYIACHYTQPLKVVTVASQSGLHPNYAMHLFRKTCGLTIMESVLQHRLFHAKRLLLTTDLKILDIAMESGFGSASRFYEAFKNALGISPKEFQRDNGGPC